MGSSNVASDVKGMINRARRHNQKQLLYREAADDASVRENERDVYSSVSACV